MGQESSKIEVGIPVSRWLCGPRLCIHSFIHWIFNEHLLHIGTAVGAGDTSFRKATQISALWS